MESGMKYDYEVFTVTAELNRYQLCRYHCRRWCHLPIGICLQGLGLAMGQNAQ
jgi:hypothetical protein